jgi:hypothetical protein
MSDPDPKRITSKGMMGPYGRRYSWLYWVVITGALVLVVLDIFGDGAEWTNVGAIVLIVIAILLQPGGLRGPKHAP